MFLSKCVKCMERAIQSALGDRNLTFEPTACVLAAIVFVDCIRLWSFKDVRLVVVVDCQDEADDAPRQRNTDITPPKGVVGLRKFVHRDERKAEHSKYKSQQRLRSGLRFSTQCSN